MSGSLWPALPLSRHCFPLERVTSEGTEIVMTGSSRLWRSRPQSSVLKGLLLVFLRDMTPSHGPQTREYETPPHERNRQRPTRPTARFGRKRIRHEAKSPPRTRSMRRMAEGHPGTGGPFYRGHSLEKTRLSRHSVERAWPLLPELGI